MIAEHPMHTHETNLIQDEHTTEYALRMRQKCHDIRACGQDLRPGWTGDIATARNFELIANDCCLDTETTRDEVAKDCGTIETTTRPDIVADHHLALCF